MISGFSGLPKLRQLVSARGRAPVQATLRAASATAARAPSKGSKTHQRGLQSTDRATALSVALPSSRLIRTNAASPPGPISVLPCTSWSYCR
jgi:hypothetical protein